MKNKEGSILFPGSWLGWLVAIPFLLTLIMPHNYLLIILIASIIITIIALLTKNNLEISKSLFVNFWVLGYYLLFSLKSLWGILVFVIGFIIGGIGFSKHTLKSEADNLYYSVYEIGKPFLYACGIFFILAGIYELIKDNSQEAFAVLTLFGAVLILFDYFLLKKPQVQN